MIDWVTCRIPLRLPRPIEGGKTITLDQDGQLVRATPHRLPLPGSFASSLQVRAPSTGELELEGNPVKWLQGHNLYGTDDLPGLLWATLSRVATRLDIDLRACGVSGPEGLGDTILTRVDLTHMLLLPTPLDVLTWLRTAGVTGRAERRGAGKLYGDDTVVFGDSTGKSFARWKIVLYSKGREVARHRLPDFMMGDEEVLEWVNRCLRAEVRFGRLELQKQGLRTLDGWASVDASQLWRAKVATLDFNGSAGGRAEMEKLPRNLRAVYMAWTTGADPRQMLSRPTFYRYRRQLLELAGVDISIPPPAVPTATIVPLRRTLEAVPAGRPAWADRVDRQLRTAGAIVLPSAA